jgi:DNA-binding response OmpR family regulator
MMPKRAGYPAGAFIKHDALTSTISVIMLTGVGFGLNKELALRTGANAYLTRPFSLSDLKKTMDPLLTKDRTMLRK